MSPPREPEPKDVAAAVHRAPADLVHCSDEMHKVNPLHERWILGRNGETYCENELGRLRKSRAPTQPVNTALLRAHKEYDTKSVEWHRHLEDYISRYWFEAPVQAENLQTYSLESVMMFLAQGELVDPRSVEPLRAPTTLIPNRAIQRLAIQIGQLQSDEDVYRLPPCSAEKLREARLAYRALYLYEKKYGVEDAFREDRPESEDWQLLFEDAHAETHGALAMGAEGLSSQLAELTARQAWARDPELAGIVQTAFLLMSRMGFTLIGIQICATYLPGYPTWSKLAVVAGFAALPWSPLSALMSATVPLAGSKGQSVRDRYFAGRTSRSAWLTAAAICGGLYGANFGFGAAALLHHFGYEDLAQLGLEGAALGGSLLGVALAQRKLPSAPRSGVQLLLEASP